MSDMNSIYDAPVGVEILAWHKEGGNFHQVKLKEDGNFGMRWNTDYRQNKQCYSGWIPMPDKASTCITKEEHQQIIDNLNAATCEISEQRLNAILRLEAELKSQKEEHQQEIQKVLDRAIKTCRFLSKIEFGEVEDAINQLKQEYSNE